MAEVNHQAGSARARRLLAFDCSGASCSAAVLVDDRIVARHFAAMARGQAEALLPMIDAAMRDAGLGFDALDAFVTTVGPGSFTGIRLGLAAAQGLSLAAAKPILPISSFEAHLAEALCAGVMPAAIAIDSRRGPVFLQVVQPGRTLAEPVQVEPEDVAIGLPAGAIQIVGDGTGLLEGHLDGAAALRQTCIHADSLAQLSGGLLDWRPAPLPAVPLYLRAPDVTAPRAAS